MSDISPEEFLDLLKDPNMPIEKRRVIDFIRNPKTQILDVSVTDYNLGNTDVITTIKIRTYE